MTESQSDLTPQDIEKAKQHLERLFPDKNLSFIFSVLQKKPQNRYDPFKQQEQRNPKRRISFYDQKIGKSKKNIKLQSKYLESGDQSQNNQNQDNSDLQSLNQPPKPQNPYKKPFQCSLDLLKKDHPALYNPLMLQRRRVMVGPPLPLTQVESLFRQQMEMQRQKIDLYGRQLQLFKSDRVQYFVNNPQQYFNLDRYYAQHAKEAKKLQNPITYEELQKYRSQRLSRQHVQSATIQTIREQILRLESSSLNQIQEMKKFFTINQQTAHQNIALYNVAIKIERAMYEQIRRIKKFNGEFMFKCEKDLVKLINVRKMMWCYIKYGYSIIELRQQLNAHVQKNRYKHFMQGSLRITIRMIEKYIRQNCRKGELIYEFRKDLVSLACPIFHIRQWFEPQHVATYMKIVRIIFELDAQEVTQLTKREIIDFYYQCEKKLARKQNMRQQLRKTAPIKPVPVQVIPYYQYMIPNEPYKKRQPFEKLIPQNIVEKFFHPELTYWTQQFQIQFMLMTLKNPSLTIIRDKLMETYHDNTKAKLQFTIQNLKMKSQKIHRKALRFMQLSFRQWCGYKGVRNLNFNEMKFLRLNDYEKRTFTTRRDGMQVKQMIIDYYLNNVYELFKGEQRQAKIKMSEEQLNNENKQVQKYRLNYMAYAIQGLINYLQSKKHLRYIFKEPDRARLQVYYLDPVLNEKWITQNVVDCLLKEQYIQGRITKYQQRAIDAFKNKKGSQQFDMNQAEKEKNNANKIKNIKNIKTNKIKVAKNENNYKLISGQNKQSSQSNQDNESESSQQFNDQHQQIKINGLKLHQEQEQKSNLQSGELQFPSNSNHINIGKLRDQLMQQKEQKRMLIQRQEKQKQDQQDDLLSGLSLKQLYNKILKIQNKCMIKKNPNPNDKQKVNIGNIMADYTNNQSSQK